MQRAQSKDGGSASPGNCHSSGLECRDHKPPIQLFLSETRRSAACVCVHITPPPSVRFSNESRSAGLRSQLKHKHSKTISQHFVPLLKTPISRFSLFSWIQMASTFNHFHSPAADTHSGRRCVCMLAVQERLGGRMSRFTQFPPQRFWSEYNVCRGNERRRHGADMTRGDEGKTNQLIVHMHEHTVRTETCWR